MRECGQGNVATDALHSSVKGKQILQLDILSRLAPGRDIKI